MDEDTAYLVSRLRRVVELLQDGNVHMAVAKLNADISALSVPCVTDVSQRIRQLEAENRWMRDGYDRILWGHKRGDDAPAEHIASEHTGPPPARFYNE